MGEKSAKDCEEVVLVGELETVRQSGEFVSAQEGTSLEPNESTDTLEELASQSSLDKLSRSCKRGGARPGAGRPKKKASERATVVVQFRLTKQQAGELKKHRKTSRESINKTAKRMMLGMITKSSQEP